MSRPMMRFPAVLTVLVLACVIPEVAFHLFPYPELVRNRMIQSFAFWPGLLRGWRANYAFQPELMFLTYGFLHAGIMHLLFNMLTLISLGRPLVEELGQGRFLILYLAAQIGGGAGYALLAAQPAPMVGASGALFGLAGALVWMRLREGLSAMTPAEALRDIAWPVLLLVGMNVVMYVAMDGQLAWETHLGGFLAGAAVMAVLWRRGDPDNSDHSP
ncbi:rhomboid family intramembrane serine protease [Sinirhodobacter populi]|uniref:Rhomboid family intramembrane serine protease n=1 Tax=Paenirhodobacter populi TaxID=2306993 RepID=A0A443K196_9RHOB|nr:rhomboid family intramembrane serine protease [Sinirhodobacter populi]RWR26524.1 rhomboid family intramembrane serine protease [Sinirhodobacter populi]